VDVSTIGLRALYDEARATPMPEDDEFVAELEQVMVQLGDREAELAEGRAVLLAQSQQLSELEEVAGAWRERIPAKVEGPTAGEIALSGLTIAGLVSLGVPLVGVAAAIGVAVGAAAASSDESDES
jgi:hypothetical protein